MTTYTVQLYTPLGVLLDDISAFSAMSWSRVVNDVGVLTLTYPGTLPALYAQPNNLIVVYRTAYGVTSLLTDTAWVLAAVRQTLDDSGSVMTELTAYSGNYLLSSRGVAYQTRSTQSTKSGAADNLIKELVRENLGSSATDTARTLSNLTVQANTSQGQSIDIVAGWRDDLLIVCQECAEASTDAGTYIAFDVVYQGGTWELRTYVNQLGIDRRIPGGVAPLLLGPRYGNVIGIDYVQDWSANITAAYALGEGAGSRRRVQTALDTARIASSPYARREGFFDAANAVTNNQVLRVARAALRASRPRQTFQARIVETPSTRYGVDWGWGDYVTIAAFDVTVNARIDAVSASVSQGNESIDAWVRVE